MRALALALAALILPLSALAQPASPLSVTYDAERSRDDLDTSHLTAWLRFRVENAGDQLDYVTVPRHDIRWASNGQTALGVPTPEFGLSLAPGASGEFAVRVDFAEPRAQKDVVRVPFRSERTGATTTLDVPLEVRAAVAATGRIVVEVVDENGAPVPDAQVSVRDLGAPNSQPPALTRDPGGRFVAQLPIGNHAVRADAPGRTGASAFVGIDAEGERAVRLALPRRVVSFAADPIASITVDDSIWLLAASDDLRALVTAPMTHSQPSPGRFHAILDGEPAWSASMPASGPPLDQAGPFQALDTFATVSADGALVATFGWDGVLSAYDAAAGRKLWSTDLAGATNPRYPANSAFGTGFFTSGAAAFSTDGAQLVAGGSNGFVASFDVQTGDLQWTLATGGEVRAMRFSPDGSAVFVGSGDWRFRRVDAASGNVDWSGANEFWPFFFVALSQDGARVASGGKDAVLRVWDAANGAPQLAIDVFPGFVTGAGFTRDAVIFSDWTYGVRAVNANGTPKWFRAFPTANVATTPDGAYALVASWDPGRQRAGIELLDGASGSTLWSASPDVDRACTTTLSPFPARQLRSVHVAYENESTLRAAFSCIGGGVFTTTLRASAAGPPVAGTTPPATTTPTRTTTQPPGATTTPSATTIPTPTSPPAQETPGFGFALAALAAALVALARHRRGAS